MWTSILGFVTGVPGLLAGAWRLLAGAFLYGVGRRDQANADRNAALQEQVAEAWRQRQVQENLRRLAPDARRDRLRRWERPKP